MLNRDKNDEEIANERMKQFNEDVHHWKNYDFVVINDDLNSCYNQIIDFIEKDNSERIKNPEYQKLIAQHVENLTS